MSLTVQIAHLLLYKRKKSATPLGIEPRISGSVDQRLIHWAMESLVSTVAQD